MLARFRLGILFLSLACSIWAQTTASTLAGVVKDGSGAVIPGAKVLVINEDSGVALTAVANQAGLYRVIGLSPASFRVEAEAAGFQKLVHPGVTIQISQTVELDLTLQVGDVKETVNITGSTPILETESASVGQLVERQMIDGMPMFNRTSTALLTLIPGATIQGVTGEIPIFSVGGGRMRNQQFSLDGGNHSNTVGLAVNQSQVPLPMDALQEFRVISNNFSAEFGQTQSGLVTLATRSGTNTIHGSVFEYFRNEKLDARNFFAASRAKFRQHQFGGSGGGPIRKDRTHLFISWERTKQVTGATAAQTVPTPLQRQGDFSATLNAQGRQIPIYDPATTQGSVRQPFPGNVIPASRFDPVAKNILPYWPLPNRPGTITGATNFSLNTRPSLDRDIVVSRLDHQLRAGDQLMARYFFADDHNATPGIFPDPTADPSAGTTDQLTHNILGTWTHTFRSNLLNEFRFGLVRRDFYNQRFGLNEDIASKLGLKGVSNAAFPIINVTGFQALSSAPSRYSSPLLDFQAQEAVSWFRGKHAFKIGMETRWGIFNDDTDTSSSGNFSFGQLLTALPNTAGTGNAFATFLLGQADSANIIRPDPLRSRASYWGVYIQDDWRVSRVLTVNLGLRWEGTTPRTEDQNRINAFDIHATNPVSNTPGVVTFAGRNGVPRSGWNFDPNNFGPRAGIAWHLHEHTVVRGGGGVFYGATVNSIVGTSAALGFSTNYQVTASQPGITSAVQLQTGFPTLTRIPVDQLGPGFGAVPVGSTPNTAVTFFERSRPTPISFQYNLGIQHELAANFLLEVDYLANLSHHLTGPDRSINQVPPSLLGPGNAQVRRPFPQFSNVSVLNPPLGNSAYHAGTVKVERRFKSGLSVLAHYTFSKYLDDVESFTELGDVGSYQDYYNRRLDRGLSGSNITHRGVLSAVYELPLLRNRGWITRLFGGWKIGEIATFQSGPSFTVYSPVDATGSFPPGTIRADLIGDPHLAGTSGTLGEWFNTNAFRAPAAFHYGTAGRSILEGPGLWNLDSSWIKNFPIRERLRAEVRAEFFNFLNHANFGLPGHSVGTPAFGVISTAAAARSSQLAARIEF
jgi:Carboxypeptidase regulatory-like domain